MNILKKILSPFGGFFRWFRNTSLKKKILTVVGVGVILFLIYRSFFGSNQEEQVTTDTVKRTTIVETVSESGNIQSNQVNIYSSTNGVIQEIFVENGDEVKEGQKLFTVESTATSEDKAKAYASYQSALTSLNSAKNNLRSAEASVEKVHDDLKGHDSDETFAQKETRTKAEVAKDNAYDSVKSAQANLVSAELAYRATQDSTAIAPIAGTVANLGFSAGNNVSALSGAGTTASGTPVLVLGTLEDYEVKLQLSEVEISKIKVGQSAAITVNAIRDKVFTGSVVRADEYGTNTSGVITFNAYIKLNDPSSDIKPLMSATVSVETAKHENTLVVPNSAVKPYQGGKAVQIQFQNGLRYQPVKVGIKSTNETEILDGVTEGMEVVTGASSSTSTETASGGVFFGGRPR